MDLGKQYLSAAGEVRVLLISIRGESRLFPRTVFDSAGTQSFLFKAYCLLVLLTTDFLPFA
jgi:hypothetical protein